MGGEDPMEVLGNEQLMSLVGTLPPYERGLRVKEVKEGEELDILGLGSIRKS